MSSNDLEFVIELEYDPIKNNQLGQAPSKPSRAEHGDPEEPSVENLQTGSETGGRSYLSIIPTTIQQIVPGQTLFVWHAYFHPGLGRRFESVVITCKFSLPPVNSSGQQPTTPSSPLKIIAHAPRKAFGGMS